jgi:hypothetical protein
MVAAAFAFTNMSDLKNGDKAQFLETNCDNKGIATGGTCAFIR